MLKTIDCQQLFIDLKENLHTKMTMSAVVHALKKAELDLLMD